MSLSTVSNKAEGWTPDLLIRLDWRRFVDLVRLVIAKGGYRPLSMGIRKDGVGLLSIADPMAKKPESLAGFASWNHPLVGGNLMRDFVREMGRRRFRQAVFFTPGTFADEAVDLACGHPVELVDGQAFLQVVARLSADDQRHLFTLSTAGSFDVPTCPTCDTGMHLIDPAATGELADLTLGGEETVVDAVCCAKLAITRKARVHFLQSVFAEHIVVAGRAVGNFACAGTVRIRKHGCLIGTLEARALNLEPGGTLDGDLSILNGETLTPPQTPPELMRWRCPRCRLNWPTRQLSASSDAALPFTDAFFP